MSDKDYAGRGVLFRSLFIGSERSRPESDRSSAREQEQKGVSIDLHRDFFSRGARAPASDLLSRGGRSLDARFSLSSGEAH